ncbi:MAG: anti-sigma factor [Actinomycetota bacterium]|nr:anti-sigma factor [Actinomycetota bacterium]
MDEDTIHGSAAAYALDALDEREAGEYEAHLARCPACRSEVASMRETATMLAYATETPAPPDALRARILAEARKEHSNVVPLRRRFALPVAATVAAAAASVAVGLGIWAASLSSELESERESRSAQERVGSVLADPSATRVPLSGASGALIVARTGEAALVVSGLDPAPGDKIYEAWVSADGKRMLPAGTFEASGERTIVRLKRSVPEGGLVAVTIEDEEVDQPTGTPLFTAKAT